MLELVLEASAVLAGSMMMQVVKSDLLDVDRQRNKIAGF